MKVYKISYGHLDRISVNLLEVIVFKTSTVKKKHKFCVNYTSALSFMVFFLY